MLDLQEFVSYQNLEAKFKPPLAKQREKHHPRFNSPVGTC